MDRGQGNMSAMYVPTKRKTSRPQLKLQTPDVPKCVHQEVAPGVIISSVNEESSPQTITRAYGRKKFHNLQPVSMGSSDHAVAGTSRVTVVHLNRVNGSERRSVPASHGTACKPEEKAGAASGVARETDFEMKKKRKMEEIGRSSLKKYIEEVKQTVPVIVPVAQYTQRSQPSCSTVTPREFPYVKKETPSYPPGSQEEKWQLQILAKGRVNCPKCKSVGRKTVEGLKKHLTSCKLHIFTCQHCGKQLKTSTGMKYHLMADHNKLPTPGEGEGLDDQAVKEKLRKVLKRLGKLKCAKEGCTGSFTSIMGYLYHMKKCGKEEAELEKLLLNCKHCGKPYRSKAGLEYHLKSEHGPPPQEMEDEEAKSERQSSAEHEISGRAKRMSAQVAIFHLREIANQELLKEWPKRKVQRDLVPDTRKLRYTRPGLPAFSQDVLRKWKNEVKMHRKVRCPNKGCGCYYTSVSGLKAHLGICTLGEFHIGKYKCLICKKEFNSESGVKYHISSVHSQEWFMVKSKAKPPVSCRQLRPKTKSCSVALSSLPVPKPALRFTQGPCTWQDAPDAAAEVVLVETVCPETTAGATAAATAGVVVVEEKASGKDSSSGSGSSSSESEAEEVEASGHDAWALNRPLAQPEQARSKP